MSDNLSPDVKCTRCGSPLHLSCGVGEQEPTDDELTIARLTAERDTYRAALEELGTRVYSVLAKVLAKVEVAP